jgi:hypothetical protein
MRYKLEACEDTPDLGKMIRVFGANQKMNVNEAGFRRRIKSYLDVREDELNVREPPGNFLPKNLFVRVGDVIVCNSDGFDSGRESFNLGEVGPPRIAGTELVVQNGSGRVNVRLPAPPF